MATGDKIGGMSLGSSVKTNASIAERFFNSYISNVTSKINEIVHFVYAYDSSGKGGVLNTPTDPRYTLGINFSTEKGISPISSGIDGTSIYTFSSTEMIAGKKAYETLNPVFWKQDSLSPSSTRPRTIYETFLSVMSRFDSQLEAIRSQIVVSSSPGGVSEYTKAFIGQQAFSPTGINATTSMAYRIDYLSAKINEIKEDVYGDQHNLRSGLDNTGQSVWSLLQIVDTLLELHGGADYMSEYTWENPIVLNHDSVEDLITEAITEVDDRISDLESSIAVVKSGIDGNLSVMGIQDLFLQASSNHLENTYGVDPPSNVVPIDDWNPSVGVLLGLFTRLTTLVSTTLNFSTSALTSIDSNYSVQVVPAASSPSVRSLIVDEGNDEVKNFITLFLVAPKGSGGNFEFSLKNGATTTLMHTCNNTTTFSLIVLIRVWDSALGKSKYSSIKFDDLKMIANAWT
jgi:hypothetical protein